MTQPASQGLACRTNCAADHQVSEKGRASEGRFHGGQIRPLRAAAAAPVHMPSMRTKSLPVIGSSFVG